MNRSTRLEPITRLADQRQQDAARMLRESQAELGRYHARLREIRDYREEYLQRFAASGAAGMSAEQMNGFRAFLGQLDAAIEQLERLVARAARHAESKRTDWTALRARFRALEETVVRCRSDEQREALRREQKETDEHAARGGRRPLF